MRVNVEKVLERDKKLTELDDRAGPSRVDANGWLFDVMCRVHCHALPATVLTADMLSKHVSHYAACLFFGQRFVKMRLVQPAFDIIAEAVTTLLRTKWEDSYRYCFTS